MLKASSCASYPLVQSRFASLSGLLFLGAAVFIPTFAQAEEGVSKEQCAHAYETAQEAKAEGRFQESIAELRICAQPVCPSFVQTECAAWLDEVEAELPSIVVRVVGKNGEDVDSAVVKIDEEIAEGILSGRAFALNPGKHQLWVQLEGEEPKTQSLMVSQGQKNRLVTVSYEEKAVAGPTSTTAAPIEYEPNPLRVWSYVIGGTGLAAIGVGIGVGLAAVSDQNTLESDCGLTGSLCDQDEYNSRKDSIDSQKIIADITWISGAALAIGGVVMFIATPPRPKKPAEGVALQSWGVTPLPGGGGFATLGGSF